MSLGFLGVVDKQEDNTHVDLMLWSNLRPCPEALLESYPLGLQRRHTHANILYTSSQQLSHQLIKREVIEEDIGGRWIVGKQQLHFLRFNFVFFAGFCNARVQLLFSEIYRTSGIIHYMALLDLISR